MNKKYIWIIGLLLLIGLIVIVFSQRNNEESEGPNIMQPYERSTSEGIASSTESGFEDTEIITDEGASSTEEENSSL